MFSIYYHDLLLNTNSEGSMFQKLIIYKLKENKDSQKKRRKNGKIQNA